MMVETSNVALAFCFLLALLIWAYFKGGKKDD